MSEPIRTVAGLVQACCDLTLDRDDLAALECPTSVHESNVEYALSMVPGDACHANRILDYLGLDYCRDGETPREALANVTAERDRYRDALVRVAQLWRAALPRPKGGQQAGVQHYVINNETSRELQRLLIAAGIDPDTLGGK